MAEGKELSGKLTTIRGRSERQSPASRQMPLGQQRVDPLNPRKWKSKEGRQNRYDVGAKEREQKQDLLIMIDHICKKGSADAFGKLT